MREAYHAGMDRKNPLLLAAQRELEQHSWGHFIEGDTRTVGEGGKGTIAVGCEHCKIRLNTVPQYLQHLAEDVLPRILDDAIERTAISEN